MSPVLRPRTPVVAVVPLAPLRPLSKRLNQLFQPLLLLALAEVALLPLPSSRLVMGSQPSWPEARRTWYQPPWRSMIVTPVLLGTLVMTLASEYGPSFMLAVTTVWAAEPESACTPPSTRSSNTPSNSARLMPSPVVRTTRRAVPVPSLYRSEERRVGKEC